MSAHLILLLGACADVPPGPPTIESTAEPAPVPAVEPAPVPAVERSVTPDPPPTGWDEKTNHALNSSPWFAGTDPGGRRWWVASEAPVARMLMKQTLDSLTGARARGVSIELYENVRRDTFQVRAGGGALRSAECFPCGAETMARLVSADAVSLTFQIVGGLEALCPLSLLGSTADDASLDRLELRANGTVLACGRVGSVVPGVSGLARLWSLERAAAGPRPPGYSDCYVVRDPTCVSTRLRKRCVRVDGREEFMDDEPDPLQGRPANFCSYSVFRGTAPEPE